MTLPPPQIDAHEDDVNAVAFADSSSQLLFSGSDDALCKVWDRRTLREDRPQPVGQLAGHRDGVTFIDSKVRRRRGRGRGGGEGRRVGFEVLEEGEGEMEEEEGGGGEEEGRLWALLMCLTSS